MALLLYSSCKNEYKPRNIENVTITVSKMDDTSIRAIKAIDKNTVYYVGSRGDFGYTNDNGKSWTTETVTYNDSIKPHFRSIAYNGTAFFGLSIESPALLYKFSDKDTQIVYKEEHEKAFYDSMKFFADGKHGIAVGDPIGGCASIILTSDGGNSWKKISCDNLPHFEREEAFFAASNTNIKVLGNTVWIASGGARARILKSIDFGQTWEIFETPITQGVGAQGMYSVDFYDANNGIAFGGDFSNPLVNEANKAITNDGGKTWKLVANKQNPNYKSGVQYVPNTNGMEVFAVGKTGISYSNDGGNTWTDVSKDGYYAIDFVDNNTAWLSGENKIGKLILE